MKIVKLILGYLLSPKDICNLNRIHDFVAAGVKCFKIEGRMKSEEYVSTVTRVYRKYIDNKQPIDSKDVKDLLQAFNRGGFSDGSLEIFKESPKNTGITIGSVFAYNANKGHIKFELKDNLSISDTISFESEDSKYTVSEIMIGNTNVKEPEIGSQIEIGRMKGNISSGDKIYKLSTKFTETKEKKLKISCSASVKKDMPITLSIKYNDISLTQESNIVPVDAINAPITKERIINQISKTGNTPFEFSEIVVDLEDNLFIPNISGLNELRRQSLEKLENIILDSFKRTANEVSIDIFDTNTIVTNKKISVLLNNLNYDYSNLENVDSLYIPLKYFLNKDYEDKLITLANKFNVYIYMPNIIRKNFTINYGIKVTGAVISNISNISMLKPGLELIGNYTLNVFNNFTATELQKLGINRVTISPELNKETLNSIYVPNVEREFIVYGKLPIMTSSYCLIGNTINCKNCNSKCKNSKYYLKDRLNYTFPILPDPVFNNSIVYNSRITSLSSDDINVEHLRIDILDETVEEINNIIKNTLKGKRLEGNIYTSGNLNREI